MEVLSAGVPSTIGASGVHGVPKNRVPSTVGASGVHGVPKNASPSTVGASGVHGQTVKKYFFCRIRCFHPSITIFATF